MIVQRSVKPWLRPLTPALIKDVSGFVTFLETSLSAKMISDMDCFEVEKKLGKLYKWRAAVEQLVPAMYQDNYIDTFEIPTQPFYIHSAVFRNAAVKVFVLTESDNDRVVEEKREVSEIQTGFVFRKCLRKVRSKNESRDIYTAFRCDFDACSLQILRVYEDDKFIIKRVGKSSSHRGFNQRLRREFKVQSLLTQLDHEGINKLVSYHEDERSIFAISFSGGDLDLLDALQGHVNDHKQPFCEERIRKLFRSSVEALCVAHNLGIAHRDVSMENLVVSNFEEKNSHLQVIDWGHSVTLKLGRKEMPFKGVIGKERYFAPELVERDEDEEFYDPFKADVFSLGVCLFSSFVGQMPFEKIGDSRSRAIKDSATTLLDAISDVELSDEARDLLNKCLEWNPEKRLSMEEVLDHPFFA